MEKVELDRFQVTGLLGSGADYEVRGAVDQQTGEQVVLKRPIPQMISRKMHAATEARTDRILQVYREVGSTIDNLVTIVGYTDRAVHDEYYGDTHGQEYTVMVEERAKGIPLLVGDMRARITGVPTGAGQNLFALFPLIQPQGQQSFPVHQQLMDVEDAFLKAGYFLLDLRPQNLFYQPASGRITIVDCGALVPVDGQSTSRHAVHQDIHDICLEVLKFYTTPDRPPIDAQGYREPRGLRPVVNFQEELGQMEESFAGAAEEVRKGAVHLISKVRDRSYTNFADFRADLTAWLETVKAHGEAQSDFQQTRQAWLEALEWLRGDHWQRYLFDADAELAVFSQ
ncbi:MAG: hypothetical protein IH962_02525 [Chloroflexi bacterium]|nr:hypothetical protein [Chloroflexota bacterium]